LELAQIAYPHTLLTSETRFANRIVKKGLSLTVFEEPIMRKKGETPPKRALLELFFSITKPFMALGVLVCHRSSESAALIFLGRWAF
jgi:hypothetical protein